MGGRRMPAFSFAVRPPNYTAGHVIVVASGIANRLPFCAISVLGVHQYQLGVRRQLMISTILRIL